MSAIALASLLVMQPAPDYVVQPYYVYPNDFTKNAAYAQSIARTMEELREWYRSRVGSTFTLRPVIEVRSRFDYAILRLGENPSEEDRKDPRFMPQWLPGLRQSLGGTFRPKQVSVIFAHGGGGYSVGRLEGEDAGFAVVGDWVLGPISSTKDPQGIPAPEGAWQVRGSVPLGILAARLGQAFGLLNPSGYPGTSIVTGFQSFPNTSLLPHERLILRESPFFGFAAGDVGMPRLSHEIVDRIAWGESLVLQANGPFSAGDMVEISHVPFDALTGQWGRMESQFVPVQLGSDPNRARVTVPRNTGPGLIRLTRGALRSNVVAVNFVREMPKE